jgi:hypothetical protein
MKVWAFSAFCLPAIVKSKGLSPNPQIGEDARGGRVFQKDQLGAGITEALNQCNGGDGVRNIFESVKV